MWNNEIEQFNFYESEGIMMINNITLKQNIKIHSPYIAYTYVCVN